MMFVSFVCFAACADESYSATCGCLIILKVKLSRAAIASGKLRGYALECSCLFGGAHHPGLNFRSQVMLDICSNSAFKMVLSVSL
jgi:hypothetical protein